MRPLARLVIDGKDVTTEVFGPNGVLVSMTITDQAGIQSDSIQIELDDREGFKAPPHNAQIEVWLGYAPQPVYMGKFKVDEWTKRGPTRTLSITARSAELTTEIRAPKRRSWHGKTLGEIVNTIGAAHGLGVVVDPSMAGLAIAHIDQQTESDLAFLTRLAKRNDAVFKLADGKIVFAKRGATLPSGRDNAQLDLKPGMVSSWTATSQNRGDYKSATADYMDHANGKRVSVKHGDGAPVRRDRVLYASSDEAKRAARGALNDLKRGKANMETEGEGLPEFFAGVMVNAVGFDADIDGVYLAKTVTHTLQSSGYQTTLTLESKGGEVDDDDGDQTDPE